MKSTSTARTIRGISVGLVALALPLALAACGSGGTGQATPVTQMGSVTGHLLFVGGTSAAIEYPASGTVVLTDASGASTKVHTSASGYFRTSLPVGTYKMIGHSPASNSRNFSCSSKTQPLAVKAGVTVTRELWCEGMVRDQVATAVGP